MIVLGLTGSIGMGKSTTADMFCDAGIPVFDADKEVHNLQGLNGAAVTLIKELFPNTVVGGGVDRTLLAIEVLNDSYALKQLEEILHPLVRLAQNDFINAAKEAGEKIVVLDMPLLFEKGGHKLCDYVVVVSAPKDIQRTRVLSRPNMTTEKFESILSKQVPDAEKRNQADFVVETGNGLDDAKAQVETIINQLKPKELR
jgi:dephospho-CoA kinase